MLTGGESALPQGCKFCPHRRIPRASECQCSSESLSTWL